MGEKPKTQGYEETDFISSDKAKTIFAEQMKHDDYRTYVQKIITDYVDSVPFMEKVNKYASMEIDRRLFTSARYYLTAILTAIITSIIGLIIGKLVR